MGIIVLSFGVVKMERVALLRNQLSAKAENTNKKAAEGTLTIVDNRTGKKYDVKIQDNLIKATDIGKIVGGDGEPLRSYDPGYMNTVCCTSRISYIDGDNGILEYRGYPIEQLAEKSSFLEVSFLLIYGELPSANELEYFTKRVMSHTFLHTDAGGMMKAFRYNAHPMGMFISTLAAISTFHPEANPALSGQTIYKSISVRNKQIHRLLGIVPTIAANAYRHREGRSYNKPDASKGYVENFLFMLDRLAEHKYKPHPRLVRALEILFILHAEHELNCSTAAARHLSSSGVDVYTTMAGAASALYGPLHGGANEAVLRMLMEIGDVKNIPAFIEGVKNKKALLFGFGHRIYKSYDPRAKIVKSLADEVFSIVGREPMIEVAMELEKIALSDPYFIERKLYPNVDFYTGIIYRAMGFPTDMFPLLFTIPRMAGWIAHWNEFLDDPENKIVRPRQHYVGSPRRELSLIHI
eukprot:TRINITY_DN1878_c0_g1_i4.p1 TRINITY_DN1878_c0_g1~~TRINITY_DN1878_c0_g1_i4.p1  ORF type:complete len:467 (-),score=130.23 TRINITY_DN1878_c0_g1_i4:74-1474(-)